MLTMEYINRSTLGKNWKTFVGSLFVVMVVTLKISYDITAANIIQVSTPSEIIDEEIDVKTILLWNTLFEDETFGLRQGC